jgi:hypothetical protein
MRQKITLVFGIIFCFILSKSCIRDYRKGGDNKAISNYEKMLFDNSTKMAELSSKYNQVKIFGGTHYDFRYKFFIDGQEYEGGHSFDELPKTNLVKVYYLKSDPYFNCVDPEMKIEIEKRKNSSKEDLYWGIGWAIVCISCILGLIDEIRKKTPQVSE